MRICFLLIIGFFIHSQLIAGQEIRAGSTVIAFRQSEQTLGNTRSFGVDMGDVDLDGDNDIFITDYLGSSRLWLNDGTGYFTQSSQSFNLAEVHGVNICDFNGDSYPDILLLSHVSPSKIYFNDGAGLFTPGVQNIGVATDYPAMAALGDVDRDGDIDAFIVYWQVPNRLWLNDGNGVLSVTETEYGDGSGGDMAVADFNGDSFVDLFITFANKPDEIWINDGSGSFINSGQGLGNNTGYEHVADGDIDGDTDIDLVTSNSVDGAKIWLNQDNTGTFIEAGPYFETASERIALFDADLDGDLDLITTHNVNGNKLWKNNGSGVFTSLGQILGSARVLSIACGKLDNDNDLDVLFGKLENMGGNTIYFNESVEYVCGDADGNKDINILDIVFLINYKYKGGPAPNPEVAADVDSDGNVNILDIVYLINYKYKSGPAPNCMGVPVLTTAAVGGITQTTAECGGTITSDGGAEVTARGVCWSTNPIPTITDNKTTDGAGIGSFTSSIIGLTAGTTYYVRAYATNSAGTSYGNAQSFSTEASSSTVTDIDGNVYQIVTIGTQVWMAENLKVTHYRNGEDIPNITDATTWSGLTTGAYCEYNNDVNNVATYGRLYNFYAVADSRNIAPTGWHVPTDAEWQTLVDYLGGNLVAGGKMKEAGTAHWISPNTGATNESGFSGLPGGYRNYSDGIYGNLGHFAVFWSSTEYSSSRAWYRYLSYSSSEVYRASYYKLSGYSVLCVRDY